MVMRRFPQLSASSGKKRTNTKYGIDKPTAAYIWVAVDFV